MSCKMLEQPNNLLLGLEGSRTFKDLMNVKSAFHESDHRLIRHLSFCLELKFLTCKQLCPLLHLALEKNLRKGVDFLLDNQITCDFCLRSQNEGKFSYREVIQDRNPYFDIQFVRINY